jgi:hypothetical protein
MGMLRRRGLLAGLLFAPAIIRTPGLLMPVKAVVEPVYDPNRWGVWCGGVFVCDFTSTTWGNPEILLRHPRLTC